VDRFAAEHVNAIRRSDWGGVSRGAPLALSSARGYVLALGAALVSALGAWLVVGALESSVPAGSSTPGGGSVSAGLASADSLFAPLPGAPAGPLGGSQRARLDSAYGRLPLAFEPNVGQADPRARFLARGAGYTLALTRNAAVLSLAGSAGRGTKSGPAQLSIGFAGASGHPISSGQRALPGRINYLVGSDRARWRTDVPTYSRVGYRNLWPGIGATFYGNQGRLEYDLTVAPGADPGRIALTFGGASSVRVERGGGLRLSLPGGVVRQLQPRAYQVVGGGRRTVASRYVVRGGRVGVALGSYDHRLAVVIDPVLIYSTYLGGSGSDQGFGIAVDTAGAAYITGSTSSTNFPTASSTTSPFQGSNGGSTDAFVTKLNPSGSGLVYSTYLGGSGADSGNAIAVDLSGNAYVAGATASANFPTAHPFQGSNGGGANDAFVAKLNPNGDGLVYSTYLGGSGVDVASAIAVDFSGAAYVAGNTKSTNFPTASPFQGANAGGSDAFVTKLNSSGGGLVYSTYLGGSNADSAAGIAIDSLGNAYVTGLTMSTDFPAASSTSSPFQSANAGGADAFVTKFNPAGSALVYSTYLGGSGDDHGSAIAVDQSGNAYVTGVTDSTNFPTASPTTPFQSSNGGSNDAFVTKLNPAGSALVYSTYLGGSGDDGGDGIAVDGLGSAYVGGTTNSTNFPTAGSPIQGTLAGSNDAFVTKLKPDGSALLYSTYLGGSGNDQGLALAVDFTGAIYLTGETASTNFPAASSTSSPFQSANAGGTFDAFVTKFSGPPVVATGVATGVTQTAATLNGSVNPNGDQTSYHFDVGPTTAYGAATASVSVGADSSSHPESQTLTGIAPGTTVHYRIVASNSAGTSFGADQQFVTGSTVSPAATPPAGTPQPPVITAFDLTPKAFRAARSGPSAQTTRQRGSRVSFTVSEPAVVAFTVQRGFTGRRVGGHCRRRTRRNRGRRRCSLFRAVPGSFTVTGHPGPNSFRFSGRLNGRRLRPRRYRLVAQPSANGLQGTPVNAGFRITRR